MEVAKEGGEFDVLSPVDFCKAFNPICLTFCKRASDTMSGKFTLIGLKPDWHSSKCRYCRTTVRFFSDFLSPELRSAWIRSRQKQLNIFI